MLATLKRSDFQRLVEIIAHHPDFATEDGRWGLIKMAFHGVDRASSASAGLDLGGNRRNAAVALVSRLSDFGCLSDRHSLALVLEEIRERVGDDMRSEFDRLITDLDAHCRASSSNNGAVTRTTDILHLSDLHFGALADAHNFHSQLAEDLKGELNCKRLDGLIVSGDLTQRCTDTEYATAVEFLTLLAGEFDFLSERIVLVPGNHDLSWDLSEAAYDPGGSAAYDDANSNERSRWIRDGSTLLVRNEDRYRKRFESFSTKCHVPLKGMPYPSAYPDQFSFHHWPELGVLVLGLNSAWEIDHHHKARAGIHPHGFLIKILLV